MLTLEAKPRDTKESLDSIRDGGLIPAVFYGKKEKSTPISVPSVQFLKVWKEGGESSVITLKRQEGDVEALIQDIDFDPVTGNPRHADFYVFEKGHKLEISVALEFIGVPSAVKDLGGLLVKVMHELKIEAMPKDLPARIDVDVSGMTEIGSQILAGSIKLGEGVELKEKEDEVVALIAAPKEEEEEEVAPVDLSAIEVEKKGKEKNAEEGGEVVAEDGATGPAKEEKK
jgi:large subunit ribosomal protein L25